MVIKEILSEPVFMKIYMGRQSKVTILGNAAKFRNLDEKDQNKRKESK